LVSLAEQYPEVCGSIYHALYQIADDKNNVEEKRFCFDAMQSHYQKQNAEEKLSEWNSKEFDLEMSETELFEASCREMAATCA